MEPNIDAVDPLGRGTHRLTLRISRQQGLICLQDTARYAPGVVALSEAEVIKRWNSQGFITKATGEVLRPLLSTGSARKKWEGAASVIQCSPSKLRGRYL